MKEPVLIIMAAGMGSRYGGLKQMDPISKEGEIILDFSLYDAMMAGFKKVVFVIKHEIEEDFKKLIEGRADKHLEVEYAFQELTDLPEGYAAPADRKKPWGTCHAVLAANKLVDGPFAVINSDDYYGPTAFMEAYDYLCGAKDDEKYRYAMVAYRLEKTLSENGSVARGVCAADEKGLLAEINERTKILRKDGRIVYTEDDGATYTELTEGTPVSMNFWCFTRSFMDEAEKRFPAFLDKALAENPEKAEYPLPTIVDSLLKEGKATVRMLSSPDKWYGVTYREDKQDVVDALQSLKDKGFYPEKLWK